MSTNNEFKVVTRRKKTNRSRGGVHRLTRVSREEVKNPEIDVERVSRGVADAIKYLEDSEYWKILSQGLDRALVSIDAADDPPDVVCYGLGNFSEYRASRYQLAALLAIKSRFHSNVTVYDPLFYNSELDILKNFGVECLGKNEEAKRAIETTTLVYMPHCPYQLTNNFIYSNWKPENLGKCIILCNSFKELADSIYTRNLEDSVNYIARINPFTHEIPLKNCFEYEEIFNGSSIHIFLPGNLERVSPDDWASREVPIYLEENCEFVRNSQIEDD